ncbi:MAG: lipopolysaccharide biosynthesis protein [Prevotella sp.]|nr:lipopolysaccharide biosynthesis protein [Prevotella sp.]
MASIRSLAKDTAIYGLSSIVARFINYLLVPIQTAKFSAAGGEYGIITNVYAYVALLIIILTYGMETTFFRFMSKEGENPQRIFSTTLRMLATTSLIFAAMVLIFKVPIASAMGYGDHPEYVWVVFVTVAIDAFIAIPMAYLRFVHKPLKFAGIQIFNILLTITLNLLYLVVFPYFRWNVFGIYDDQFTLDVAWVFYINIICTLAKTLLLHKEIRAGIGHGFDWQACRRMLLYALPLFIMGIAGQLNQTASQMLFPYFFDGTRDEAVHQLGIYGACIKIAMIMVMITQAFRYAYEPFVFGKSKEQDNREIYAKAMKYYLIFTLLAFLVVMGYIDILRHLVGRSYWEGLRVVPIVMAAEIMFGVFFNLSFWYKLTDRTIWGAYFSGIGAVILIAMIVLLIPRYSYMACAWAGFAAYGVSMVLSYVIGQRYYPVNYPLGNMAFYTVVTLVLFGMISYSNKHFAPIYALTANTAIIGIYVLIVVKRDFPLINLPVVGKYFKKQK